MYNYYLELKRIYFEREELRDMSYIPPTFTQQLVATTVILLLIWAMLEFFNTQVGKRFLEKIEFLF